MDENRNKVNEEIEIIEFDTNENKSEKVVNTLEERKNNRIIIIIVIAIALFAFILPSLTKIFNKDSNQNYSETVDKNSQTNLINGFIQIDKTDSNIVFKNIKFYNFIKRGNDTISYNYKASSIIKNVKSLNIYIEIYNSSEKLIYREEFFPSNKIEKGPVNTSNIKLNSLLYKEAYFVKIVEMDNNSKNVDNSLICTKNFVDDIYDVTYTIKYNFTSESLLSYEVDRKVTIIENPTSENTEITDKNKYNDIFFKEQADIENTNVTSINRDDNHINYIIDLRTLDLKESEYEVLYKIGTIYRTIELVEESDGWICE